MAIPFLSYNTNNNIYEDLISLGYNITDSTFMFAKTFHAYKNILSNKEKLH